MNRIALPPIVTGISPIEGVPGTKVTIRGENLGTRPEDIVGLTICGVDCLMSAEWKSSNKIIGRSGAGIGKGDIILTSVEGGRGTSTVQFKGYQETMGPLKESAIWVDESIFLNMAFGRKRPMSPTSGLQEDPLGLSVEGNDQKILQDELEELFPGCSGDLSSPKFSPDWFLLENHLSTSFEDLRAGLSCLRRKVEAQKEGQISFLKANVGSVIEQLDTLLELKCKFESDIFEYGRNSTQILEKAIIDCKEEADKLFEDVLQRKDRADGTRNALNVLHRYRFLLYLPVNIERHIQKGDYDVVINDYARAKSLFGDTQIPLFRRFYNEVENRITDLRKVLSEQLIRMPSSLEKEKKIIRYLHHLETPGDPAWECLSAQHAYIFQLLVSARDTHLNRELADHDLGSGGSANSAGAGSKHLTPSSKYNKIMMTTVGEWQATAPVRVLFVEEVCDLMSGNFPEIWKLSQAYFGGDLLPSSSQVDHSKHPRCKEMILELLQVFSGVIRGAIMPETLHPENQNFRKFHVWPEALLEQITPWLPQVLRHVRGCYGTILLIDLPNDALLILKELILDLRMHCLTWLFQQTIDHVRNLHNREKWKLEVDDENGGCTQLPHICEGVITECGQLVRETVLEAGLRDTPLLEHPTFKRDITTLIHNVIVAFAQALEKLGLRDPDDEDENGHVEKGDNLPGIEAQLLMTLSNCAFTRRIILPRLQESFIRAGYPENEVRHAVDQASTTFSELQDRLFEAYLEERVDPIIGMIERSMYLGNYDWGKVGSRPTDVRTYVKEILINITYVHAEVVSVWPGLVGGLVGRVVDGVGEEMARLISCVGTWSPYGILQAHIDLTALTTVLKCHMSSSASSSFQEAQDILKKLSPEELRLKEDIMRKFRTSMRFLLACFMDLEPLLDITNSHSLA